MCRIRRPAVREVRKTVPINFQTILLSWAAPRPRRAHFCLWGSEHYLAERPYRIAKLWSNRSYGFVGQIVFLWNYTGVFPMASGAAKLFCCKIYDVGNNKAQTWPKKLFMAAPARLVIQNSDGATEVIQLKKGLNRLGRSAVNDFVIVDPSVSRLHCEIEVRDDGIFVRDLDSSNGTFVDGQPVTNAQLYPGQTLQLGQVRMLVEQAPVPVSEPAKNCYNHPTQPASMRCRQCGKLFCGACVHVLRRTGGKYLRLCPVCSGHCEPLVVVKPPPKKRVTEFLRKLMGKTTDENPFFD